MFHIQVGFRGPVAIVAGHRLVRLGKAAVRRVRFCMRHTIRARGS